MENGSAEKLTVETGEIADLRCLLFYPPGDAYQRGEDRSQGNISDSAATVVRAPNDMGYACAILKNLVVRYHSLISKRRVNKSQTC